MTIVNGWTVLTPSSDSRLIYVSNDGNDTNAAAVYGRGYYLPGDPEIGDDPTNPVGPIVAYKSLWRAETRLRRTTYMSQSGTTDVYGGWGRWNQLAAVGQSHRGFPDWLLLRRGDSFAYNTEGRTGCGDFPYATGACSSSPQWLSGDNGGLLRGRSESEPIVITAWGDPTSERPVRSSIAISGMTTNLRVVSIHLTGGIGWQRSTDGFYAEDIIVEDCRMRRAGATNIGAFVNCKMRRCAITGNYDANEHNQGMFISNRGGSYPVDSWSVEECIFDRNGYKEDPYDATTWTAGVVSPQESQQYAPGVGVQPLRSYFDRNIYVSTGDGVNNATVTVRGSIFSRNGGGGSVQMRQGGVVDRNLFLWNEDAGYNSSGAGGIYKDNVVLHDDHMLPPGGWGKAIGMWNSSQNADSDPLYVMDGNIAAHFHRGSNGPSGFFTGRFTYRTPAEEEAGVEYGAQRDGTVHVLNNSAYRNEATRGLSAEFASAPMVRFSGNQIAVTSGGVISGAIAANATAGGSPYDIDGNLYYSQSATPFGSGLTFAQWQALRADLDDSSSFLSDFAAFKAAAGWTAPERDIVSYMESVDPTYAVNEDVYVDEDATIKQANRQKVWEVLASVTTGIASMTEAQAKLTARRYHAFVTFIQRAKANRKGSWDANYTAEAVSNYIRQGFGKSSITGEYDNRTLNVRLAEYVETHGPVVSLIVTTQPVGDTSGQLLGVQPVVTLRDANNLTTTSDNTTQVSVAIQSGSNGTLSGTTTVTVVNGVATFTNLVLTGDDGEPYVLRFSIASPSLNVDSTNVVVSSAVLPATVIKVIREPIASYSDSTFSTQPKIVLEDSSGSLVSSDNTTQVTVAISSGLGGTLKGTTTKIAVNGIVEFTDLSLVGDTKQTYVLAFSSSGLTGDTSTVTLLEQVVPEPPQNVTQITEGLVRTNQYFGNVLSIDIDGEFNKSDLLSLRVNKTKMVGVGTQDFIIKYRDTILNNRNIDYSIPESWDLSWSFKQGPITNPNKLSNCFLWLKPEKFSISNDGTKYTTLNDSSSISTFNNNFAAITDLQALRSYSGLNSFSPLSFDGVNDVYFDGNESNDFIIPNNINFAFGFVLTTRKLATAKENTVFCLGRENQSGSFQVIVDETLGARKIKLITQASSIKVETSTANNCYTQGDPIIVVVYRINNALHINVNGVDQNLAGSSLMANVIASGSGTYIGASMDANDDTLKKFLAHDLYEAVLLKEIIDKPLTQDNIVSLEGYFAAKYKMQTYLPTNHAYRTDPPRTGVVEEYINVNNAIPSVSCNTLTGVATSINPPSDETTETVTVTVENNTCQWTANTSDNWITLSNAWGIGNGTFTFTVSANEGAERIGTITITSGTAPTVTLTITQETGISITATGGTVTESDGYRYHTFTSSGTLEVTSGGEVEVLVVGGGGAGGINFYGGGGGGGGQVLASTETLASDSYTITVGSSVAGTSGDNGNGNGANGNSSSVVGSGVSITAVGGSGGKGISPNLSGGASGSSNAGGTGIAVAIAGGGGGGGGDSAAGGNCTVPDSVNGEGGDGGDGTEWPTSSGNYYGGGGGGGLRGGTGNPGSGGLGGGGDGGRSNGHNEFAAVINPQGGTANSGGGGGGSRSQTSGGGGSGVVIIRYAI